MTKGAKAGNVSRGPSRPPNTAPRSERLVDRLVEAIDHCSAAKDIADSLGDKFLAYLLSMAIQEARASIRHTVGTSAASSPDRR